MALSTFVSSSVTDGSTVVSNVNLSDVVTAIQNVGADTYFDSTSEIARVDVYYQHVDGRQNKKVTFVAPSFEAIVSWTSNARDGVWQKVRVKATDFEGAEVNLNRASIGSSEDLTHGSGSMTLNTVA